ncbi:MAG: hypothetical protein JSU87_13735 [Gemmatimonadota bacterium]|nr:MAG: hypothetical protein JSU87_13735 [Gemmatimonadota bacterium]
MTSATCLAALTGLALSLHSPALAQTGQAFDTLGFALRAAGNINRNTFHRYWSPNPSAEVELETRFYLGHVQVGLHYASFDSKSDEQPDFFSLFPYIGWSYGWSPGTGLAWHNGARIGSFLQHYDIEDGNRTEQELCLALNSRVSQTIASGWAVDLSARYQVVYTHERLRYVFIAIGLSHAIRTPDWLRDFLD